MKAEKRLRQQKGKQALLRRLQQHPTSGTTDANDQASTTLTLGNTAESYTVPASGSGIAQSVTFTATAMTPNPPVETPNPPPEDPPPTVNGQRQPPPPPLANTEDERLIRVYYDVDASICPDSAIITLECAEAYARERLRLADSEFIIRISDAQ